MQEIRRFALIDPDHARNLGLAEGDRLLDHEHPPAKLRRAAFAEVEDPDAGAGDALDHLAPQVADSHGFPRCVAAQLTGGEIGDLTFWVTAADTAEGRAALLRIPPRDPAALDALVTAAHSAGEERKARAAAKKSPATAGEEA